MDDNVRTGVFLCECGQKIAPLVDLETLEEKTRALKDVALCERLPYPCLRPGLDRISEAVAGGRLNRVIIAGCEGSLMLKKFEKALRPYELQRGQIEMINVRGHVAAVSDRGPEANAKKALRLIGAAAAELTVMSPGIQTRTFMEGPVMIIGGGAAAYAAGQELARRGVEFLLVPACEEPDDVMHNLHWTYPGEHAYYDRMREIVEEVHQSPHGTILSPARLTGISGVTGKYGLTFSEPDGGVRQHRCSAVIACVDAMLESPGPTFGHDGKSVLTQPELEEQIRQSGIPRGQVVFWISDHEAGQGEFAALSAKSAWAMACHMQETHRRGQAVILYNQQMEIPLTAAERVVNRKLGILWVPYNKALRPTVQDHVITFCNLTDHLENELGWDRLILSPLRSVGGEGLETARVLGLVHKEGRFLTGHHARVRPEMVGREETYLAGSGRFPCDLHEALRQGRRAGKKTAGLLKTAAAGELFTPQVYCVVDADKCVGCGQCQELCDCGGIGIAEGAGGGLPRVVDPMVCTGGGTCAAACPYNALVLQNSSTTQREARAAALSAELGNGDVLVYACSWAGLPAADNCAKKGISYDPGVHIVGVPCVGQLDPSIMARALMEGAPGVLLVGCMPEDCHHSHGVDHAWSRVSAVKRLLSLSGFDRRRIAMAHADLNHPEAFAATVNNFARTVAGLEPIQRSPENVARLQAMYALIKDNARIRHLISAGLRRPWEDTYRGDQRHALDYDRDFTLALTEEFLQQRLLNVFRQHRRPFRLKELVAELHEQESKLMEALRDMVYNGAVEMNHENREVVFNVNN